MESFEDPYRSEGNVQLNIEKLSQFDRGGPTVRASDTIYVRGLPWKIVAKLKNDPNQQVELQQKFFIYYLQCNTGDTDSAWSCSGTVTLKILAQKDDKGDYEQKMCNQTFNAKQSGLEFPDFSYLTFETLMDPENGWYDEVTDSIILHVHITAEEPHGLKNVPDIVYKHNSIRSEHAYLVKYKDGSSINFWIQDKLWTFNYSSLLSTKLSLEMHMHPSDTSKTIAECIFWYWNDKEVVILKKTLHAFATGSSKISVSAKDAIPVNKKFNVVIRLLDERNASDNNSLESYYGNFEGIGIEMVTLCLGSTKEGRKCRGRKNLASTKEASFVIPKIDLIRASPVFRLMFTHEMTEKKTGKVVIEDTNPEEFGDFLKAISPKQEHPTPSNVFALLKLADRYDCQTLRDRCEEHLLNCIEIPAVKLLACAKSNGLDKLKKKLLMNFKESPGLFKMYQESKPYIEFLHLAKQMDDELVNL